MKIWIQDKYFFPFNREDFTKFLVVSNTSLLTKVFDIDVENVQKFNANPLVKLLFVPYAVAKLNYIESKMSGVEIIKVKLLLEISVVELRDSIV